MTPQRDLHMHRVFLGAAVAAVWEDTMIALTFGRNVWEGYGLTHHPGEPRVSSFTSPLGGLAVATSVSMPLMPKNTCMWSIAR